MNEHRATHHAASRTSHDQGFTLVELSIVLIVIGLIVGAVLVGRDMIKNAQIKAQITEIDKLKTAVNTFRVKYNCLPGDCKNATAYFTAAAQPSKVSNGNGDGRILAYEYTTTPPSIDRPVMNYGWTFGPWSGNPEWFYVFDHLSAAGLWHIAPYDESTTASNLPGVAYPMLLIESPGSGGDGGQEYRRGGMVAGYEPAAGYIHGGNHIRLGACYRDAWGIGTIRFVCGLNTDEAKRLDDKIDDGKPYSGQVYAGAEGGGYQLPPAAWSGSTSDGTGNCGTYATNTYKNITSGSMRGCALMIDAGF